MITRAIVEEIITPHQVKVRIPVLDRAANAPMSTDNKNLNIATICTLPNCYANLQVGDVVFVGFEDNTYYKAVVLGHLSREAMSETYADVVFGSLTAHGTVQLSAATTIGEVTSEELSQLRGASKNIQQQLNDLKNDIAIIYEKLNGGNS